MLQILFKYYSFFATLNNWRSAIIGPWLSPRLFNCRAPWTRLAGFLVFNFGVIFSLSFHQNHFLKLWSSFSGKSNDFDDDHYHYGYSFHFYDFGTTSTKKRDEVECFLIDLERRAYELFPWQNAIWVTNTSQFLWGKGCSGNLCWMHNQLRSHTWWYDRYRRCWKPALREECGRIYKLGLQALHGNTALHMTRIRTIGNNTVTGLACLSPDPTLMLVA